MTKMLSHDSTMTSFIANISFLLKMPPLIDLEPLRAEISLLYPSHTVEEILGILQNEHNINLTTRTLTTRLRTWGLRKLQKYISNPALDERILHLYKSDLSTRKILETLQLEGYQISNRTLQRARKRLGIVLRIDDPALQQERFREGKTASLRRRRALNRQVASSSRTRTRTHTLQVPGIHNSTVASTESTTMNSREALTGPVQALLKTLTASPPSIPNILKAFTTNPSPLIYEHGLPQLAPFLGRSFTGRKGVSHYFEVLAETLSIEGMTFEDEKAWLVDGSAMAVCLRGQARFMWKETGQAWDETFVYRIALAKDVSEEGDGGLKVSEYRVWADTGAAYLARCGQLGELVGGGGDDGESRPLDSLGSGLNVYGSCG